MASVTRLFRGSFIAASLVAMQFVSAPAALSATEPGSVAAESPLDQLEELDEIRVQGQRKARDITSVEDAFFRLYNELNTDDRFDVHCGYASLREHSMIMVRTCMPGYVATAFFEEQRASNAASGCNTPRPISSPVFDVPYFLAGDLPPCTKPLGNILTGPDSTSFAARADALHLRHRAEYARTVAAIVQRDERLQKMAAELAPMYEQMEAVRTRFTDRKAQGTSPVRFEHAGPR